MWMVSLILLRSTSAAASLDAAVLPEAAVEEELPPQPLITLIMPAARPVMPTACKNERRVIFFILNFSPRFYWTFQLPKQQKRTQQ